jgi:hypothetical protein
VVFVGEQHAADAASYVPGGIRQRLIERLALLLREVLPRRRERVEALRERLDGGDEQRVG